MSITFLGARRRMLRGGGPGSRSILAGHLEAVDEHTCILHAGSNSLDELTSTSASRGSTSRSSIRPNSSSTSGYSPSASPEPPNHTTIPPRTPRRRHRRPPPRRPATCSRSQGCSPPPTTAGSPVNTPAGWVSHSDPAHFSATPRTAPQTATTAQCGLRTDCTAQGSSLDMPSCRACDAATTNADSTPHPPTNRYGVHRTRPPGRSDPEGKNP